LSNLEIDNIQPKISILWTILGLRISLFSVKLETAIWSHSLSLLVGIGHLFTDLLTMGLTFISAWVIQRQSAERTTQTEQRLKAWIGLVNGISLGAIVLIIAQAAVKHLQDPESVSSLPVLLVAGFSLIGNGFAVYLLHQHRDNNAVKTDRDLNLRDVFRHGVADAASALSAILAAGAIYFFNWLWADAAAGLLVAMLIGFSAVSLMRSAWQVLRQDASRDDREDTVA